MTTPGPQLADIHLPPEPSWWPPAPGWWLLAVLFLVLLFWMARIVLRRQRLEARRRMLKNEFDHVMAQTAAPGQEARQVAALSSLLRRAALQYAPRAARLQAEAWLRFLDGDDASRPFSNGPGRLLLEGPYQARVQADAARALAVIVAARLPAFVGGDDA